jgi:hypothetical protein
MRRLSGTQKIWLELDHARDGEQQRVVIGDQRPFGHEHMTALAEEVKEGGTDQLGSHGEVPYVSKGRRTQ